MRWQEEPMKISRYGIREVGLAMALVGALASTSAGGGATSTSRRTRGSAAARTAAAAPKE